MKTLLLLSLLCAQDESREERERVDLWKRVSPAIGAVEQGGQFTFSWSADPSAFTIMSRSTKLKSAYGMSLNAATPGVTVWTTPASFTGGAVPGFLVDDRGTFVTTAGAVMDEPGAEVSVVVAGKTRKARLITRSDDVGLSILQLQEAAGLKPLPWADSSSMEPGRTVWIAGIADGAPVLRKAVLIGRSRTALKTWSVEDFLHLDYPAWPDEVGSAVLTASGEIVGIVAAPAFEKAGGTELPRRAYAIPSATFKAFLAKRDFAGHFEVGQVGVTMTDGDPGARIETVFAGSAAEKAALRPGDVITGVDGRVVRDQLDLTRVTRFKAGETVELDILRKEQKLKIKVTIGVHDPRKPEPDRSQTVKEKVGLEVTDLSAPLQQFLGLNSAGVVVLSVVPGGPADQAGLRKGDAITAIDNAAVSVTDDFLQKAAGLAKDAYSVFETWRDGKKVPVVVKVR